MRVLLFGAMPLVLAVMTAGAARAQGNVTAALSAKPADSVAVVSAGSRTMGLFGQPSARAKESQDDVNGIPAIQPPGFYPDDVSNPANRPTIFDADHHPIYINMSPSHWGNPGMFLTDLGRSNFIHLLDQYVGNSANNRYTLGTSFLATYPVPANHTIKDSDLYPLLHAAAASQGSGLEHIYHVFLPKGVDICVDAANCYSPDISKTFTFCAYHGYVTFKDAVGHVLYTVEPYQDVAGCQARPTGTPNGQLTDSTDDTLSHEVFETISDPDLTAWYVHALTFSNGNEIGDLCVRAAVFPGKNIYSFYGNVVLNGHLYSVQPEYSNQFHGCVYSLGTND